MIVSLRSNACHPDLSAGQRYVVIGLEADDFRLLNDQGRPYLYPKDLFEVEDATRPSDWVLVVGEDGETYAYPPALGGIGFFEDYFDGREEAVRVFWQAVNRSLAAA